MARLAPYENQSGIDIGSSFSAPDRVRPTTIYPENVPFQQTPDYTGQMLEGVGQAIQSLSVDLVNLANTRQTTADNSWFSKARAQAAFDWTQTDAALRQSYSAPTGGAGPGAGPGSEASPQSGEGYTQLAIGEWEKYRDNALKGAPSESARAQFQQWADGFGVTNVGGPAFEFEEASLFATRAADLNSAMDSHVRVVFDNPDAHDETLTLAMEDLERARGWMTPEQEIDAEEKITDALAMAYAGKLAKFAPLRFQREAGLTPPTGADATAAKIIGVESAGNARAANPRSSASGLGQFTDSTWVATVRKHRSDLAGLSDKDLITLKTDPVLAREMTIAHTEDNAAALTASGIEATEGNLYLAHFAGIGGARAVLGAPDDAAIVDVLGAAVVRANPFLQGKTVGWLKAWAAKKMGEAVPVDLGSYVDHPILSRLTPDQIFALDADANSAIVKQHTLETQLRTAEHAARMNNRLVAALEGTYGFTDLGQDRRAGWLGDYDDIKKLTDVITARNKDQLTTAQAMARMADPNSQFNPFVKEDRDDVDTAYKGMGGATALSSGDETSVGRLRAVVEKTDIIPESAIAALQAGIRSRDAAQMHASFAVMDGIYRAYPQASVNGFTEDDLKRLQDYQALASVTPPDELYERMDPNQDPARRKLTQDLTAEGATLAAEIETAEILDAFDTSGSPFTSDPGAPIDTLGQTALRQDFETLFAERYAVSGNVDVAKAQALERLTAKWGATEVGNDIRVMPYPPERYYQAVDGDWDWMGIQLEEEVAKQFGPDTPAGGRAQGWGIVPTQETEAEARAGGSPAYRVWVIDKDGAHRALLGPDGQPALFRFDYEAARDAGREQFEQDQQRTLPRPPPTRSLGPSLEDSPPAIAPM